MFSPNKPSPTMDMAVATVKDLIKKTSDDTLATMYKEIAYTTRDSAKRDSDKKYWQDIIDIIDISSNEETASSFRDWVEKTIAAANPDIKKQFLLNISQGILEVSRRS